MKKFMFMVTGLFCASNLLVCSNLFATTGMPKEIEFRSNNGGFFYADLGELDLSSFVFQKCQNYARVPNGVFTYSAPPVTFSFNQQIFRLASHPSGFSGLPGHLISDATGASCRGEMLGSVNGLTFRLVFESIEDSSQQIILTLELASGQAEVSLNQVGETQHYLSFGRIVKNF
jgi:hypothetical protein